MEQYIEKETHMIFINLEKAYNKAPRKVLQRCLEARSVPVVENIIK